MPTNELKPCPFCGAKAKTYDYEGERDIYDPDTLGYVDTEHFTGWCCCCEVCGAAVPEKRSEAESIEAWNTRAERTCRNVAVQGVLFECSECGAKTVGAVGNYTQEYCAACGRKVQDDD